LDRLHIINASNLIFVVINILRMLRSTLFDLLRSEEIAFNYIKSEGLISEVVFCNKCGKGYETTYCKGFQKECKSWFEGKKCESSVSVFNNSLFFNRRISFAKILALLYEWCESTTVGRTAKQFEISMPSTCKWFRKFAKIAAFDNVLSGGYEIGGPGIVIEIDESCFVSNKYRRGRELAYQKWAIGGVERGNTQNCFIEFVERRDRITLLEVIVRRVRPGSIIVTD
jgi:hypothetical protein